jgi:alpha-mannosidase
MTDQGHDLSRTRGRYAGYTRSRLAQFARRLERRIYPETTAVTAIEIAGPTDRVGHAAAQALDYRPATLGQPLGPLWATYWVRVTATVPDAWRGARVDLYWDSRSEALLRRNGATVQGLNIGRHTATLVERAKGGETLAFDLEIACNRAFGADQDYGRGAPEPYRLAACELRRFDPEAWALFHDFDVLRQLEADREPPPEPRSYGGVAPKIVRPALDTTWAGRLLHDLNRVCNVVDLDDRATWPAGRAILDPLLAVKNGGVVHELSAIGHAHIDTAWLWPMDETWRKCQRSFANVLDLMDRYPEFKFACSQACQYEVIERLDPALFARIREKAAAGQWIPIGGSWVEPDCNLPSGEAMSRQFLYGQRYFERIFGARCTLFWNPDVFGYAGQLPQAMREAGLTRFLTQKLSWNKFTAPPHHSFHWRGLDGSSVLTHFPPADTYNAVATVEELRYHAANYKDADRTAQALYLFGHGDGGGGPTAPMIETLRRTGDLLGVPRSATRSPNDFFDLLAKDSGDLATVEGELYFEYHRGTYTSQAEVKRLNRLCEGRLQTLDYLAVASGLAGLPAPSRDAVEALWRVLLTSQFHDILPGSSIHEVYERTVPELTKLADDVDAECRRLLDGLAAPGGPPRPLNPTSFARTEVVAAPTGELCAIAAPPYAAGEVVTLDETVQATAQADGWISLHNGRLTAVLSPDGSLWSLRHHASGREALSGPANRIVLFDDTPIAFEAWDIDPFALETAREAQVATGGEIVASGPLRAEVRFERPLGKASRMTQIVRLDAASDLLEFHTVIDWRDRRTLVKAVFPIAARAMQATYETLYGAVQRPTHANTDADLAQYEVPGHRWADLSEPGFGVSLLTDSRYGFSTFGDQMAVSLVRGPLSPDATADLGEHHFAYALYAHAGDWRDADTTGRAARFNRPVLWTRGAPNPVLGQSLVASSAPGVVIDTIKPAEDGDGWMVRLYESTGGRCDVRLTFGAAVSEAWFSNTLEDRVHRLTIDGGGLALSLRAFQIATLRLK